VKALQAAKHHSQLGGRGSWARYASPSRRRRPNVSASEIGSPELLPCAPKRVLGVCQINRTRLWPFVAVQRHAVALETLSLDEPISVTLDMLSVTLPNEGAQRRDELCQLRQKKLPPISPG